jgi:hypothetical protein
MRRSTARDSRKPGGHVNGLTEIGARAGDKPGRGGTGVPRDIRYTALLLSVLTGALATGVAMLWLLGAVGSPLCDAAPPAVAARAPAE